MVEVNFPEEWSELISGNNSVLLLWIGSLSLWVQEGNERILFSEVKCVCVRARLRICASLFRFGKFLSKQIEKSPIFLLCELWNPPSPCCNLEYLLSGPIPCTILDFWGDLCFPPTLHWIPFPVAWSPSFLIHILVLVKQVLWTFCRTVSQ